MLAGADAGDAQCQGRSTGRVPHPVVICLNQPQRRKNKDLKNEYYNLFKLQQNILGKSSR